MIQMISSAPSWDIWSSAKWKEESLEVLSLQHLIVIMEIPERKCERFAVIESMFNDALMEALSADSNTENVGKLTEFASAKQGVYFMEILGAAMQKYPQTCRVDHVHSAGQRLSLSPRLYQLK